MFKLHCRCPSPVRGVLASVGLIAAWGLLPALVVAATPAAATEWRLAHYLPADHFFALWLEEWARGLERETNGKLRILIQPNNQALRLGAIAPGVRDGKAELGFGPAPEGSAFDAVGLPFIARSAGEGTRIADALFREGAFDEALAGLDILFLHTNAPSVVHTASRTIRMPADLEGLRMRGATPYIRDLLAALGARPIEGFLAPQVHGALRDGAIDGTVFPYEAMGVFRLGEQLRRHTDVPLFVSVLGLYLNPDAYRALPASLRAAIDRRRGSAAALAAGQAWDAEEERGRRIVAELGNERITPSAAELAAWRERLAPFTAARLQELGPAGEGVYIRARELAAGLPR
jgi:TRAP-type C4-dicarboxylate transport system substrate-binding protein